MRVLILLTACALASCSSSLGGSGGSAPARTYVVLPNGQVEPAPTQPVQ